MHPSRGLIQGEIQRQPDQKDSEVMETLREETQNLIHEIRNELSKKEAMKEIATYYFDGKGKCFRPLITLLMSKTINNHLELDQQVLASQREIAKIAEMVHASSLLHDDVIDGSDIRRGKPTVHSLYSHKRAVIAGDFVLSVAAAMAARLRDEKILILLSQVLVDLVQGEFMQLGSKEKENERFNHYLKKSFNKTASLISFSCKAFPELNSMIMRRFQEPDDVSKALDYVIKSDGLEQTKFLALKHCQEAMRQISFLKPCPEQRGLILLTNDVVNRLK
ncbi:Decaprenyl-diphosphate synthase subunit 1 [Armadillidium nasatum]|uniref:Decaprenyl-diphosphate synthase subunit 1 n=1 Tax=Armadillidium nasatum TaxID=96803 RepID=A0A5N5T0M3_9CRUS|nr:Decaprenyl-diphosphate synthase subunit 1 [Armadillidium nasatum]